MPADWPPDKPDQTRKAREAAEALFRPRPAAPVDARPTHVLGHAPATDEQPPPRQPRILVAPPPARQQEQPVATVEPPKPMEAIKPAKESKAPKDPTAKAPKAPPAAPRARKVPVSEHQRILTLITYGMTPDQVATLYEVSVDAIEGIIAAGE